MRICHTIFQSNYTILQSHPWCTRISFSTYSLTVAIFCFVDSSHPSGYEGENVVLICISLMISKVEHLFICLLAISVSSSRTVYSNSLSTFQLSHLFFCYYSSLFILGINSSDIWFANIFYLSVVCLFTPLVYRTSFNIWCHYLWRNYLWFKDVWPVISPTQISTD